MLPTLYGDPIDWWGGSMIWGHIASALLLVGFVILIIYGIKKLSFNKTVKYCIYTISVFVIMMLTSFISSLFTPGLFMNKAAQPIATTENINKVSTKDNFYILLLDCTDSGLFNEYVEKKYKEDFKDFTYFKDAASGYSSTRNSIPLIFSGEFYKNQKDFGEFSTEAFDNSKTFKKLKEKDYNMNFYIGNFIWNSKKSTDFSNLESAFSNYNKNGFLKQTVKYILYKYLPFALKPYSKVDTIDFASVVESSDKGVYKWYNTSYYDNVLSQQPEKINDKLFQYVHLQGAHSPYDQDEELNLIKDGSGTYKQKVGAAAKLASLAIRRLKDAGVYENSTIIIMADHGWYTHVPVLYIKTPGEKNEKVQKGL